MGLKYNRPINQTNQTKGIDVNVSTINYNLEFKRAEFELVIAMRIEKEALANWRKLNIPNGKKNYIEMRTNREKAEQNLKDICKGWQGCKAS